jgi:hypothetical protein
MKSERDQQYSFHPQINMISAIIAPAVSIVDKTAEQQAKRQELLR